MQDNTPEQIATPGEPSATNPQQPAPVVDAASPAPSEAAQYTPQPNGVQDSPVVTSQDSPAQSPYESTEASPESPQLEAVNWTASEYIAHHKTGGWYALLGLITLVLAVAVFFLNGRDLFAAVIVAVVGLIFGVYAARKPQVQNYSITSAGVSIGSKTYPFNDLKSFSVVEEGAFSNITFMPLKRFMPAISIYYDPEDEDTIVAALSTYLPFEHRRRDPIDRFMSKIRF